MLRLNIIDRYIDQIAGVISCYDRVIIQGSLPRWGYANGNVPSGSNPYLKNLRLDIKKDSLTPMVCLLGPLLTSHVPYGNLSAFVASRFFLRLPPDPISR
jgi:hypothetical protein